MGHRIWGKKPPGTGRRLAGPEIQDRLFALLSFFAEYCDNNGIRYYLCSGPLLGAVRNRDLIPWDNDVDVLVPRPDYDRLLQSLPGTALGPYTLFAFEKGNSFFPHAKLADGETYLPDPSLGIPHLWLDIFPMDGLPDNSRLCALWLRFAQGLKRLPSWSALPYLLPRPTLKGQIGRFLLVPPVKLIGKLGGDGFWTRIVIRYALCFPFETSRFAGGVVSSSGPGERMNKEDFLQMTEVFLRDRAFHAPSCWETYLLQLFGKDWRIPPSKKRRPQIPEVFLNCHSAGEDSQ